MQLSNIDEGLLLIDLFYHKTYQLLDFFALTNPMFNYYPSPPLAQTAIL